MDLAGDSDRGTLAPRHVADNILLRCIGNDKLPPYSNSCLTTPENRSMIRFRLGTFALLLGLWPAWTTGHAIAGEADVVDVKITKEGAGTYRFDVTVKHADEGWKHYADAWDVVGPDGAVLGTRKLAHPHEDEQPFTRSLSGVRIPDGIGEVTLRAHDSVHEWGGAEMRVQVPR